jgi:nucleoporin NUP2
LNVSFLSAVQKAVEEDPFIDVAELLLQYKDMRLGVQKEHDGSKGKAEVKAAAPAPAKPAVAMPAPPTSFTGFGAFGSNSTESTSSSSGGFTPKPTTETKSSGFSFSATATTAAPASDAPAPPKSAFTFGGEAPKKDDSATKSYFGSTSSASTTDGASKPNPFAFGSSSTAASKPLFGGTDTSTSLFGPKPSAFGSTSSMGAGSGSLFGAPKPKEPEPATTKEADELAPPSGATSLFGSPAGTPGVGAGPGTPFGGFGRKPSTSGGSIGNPVGFAFGSPPRTPAATEDGAPSASSTPKPAAAAAPAGRFSGFGGFGSTTTLASAPAAGGASPFSFGAAPVLAMPAAQKADEGTGAAAEGEDAPKAPEASDDIGEGEEDEDTSYELKGKAFELLKDKAGMRWGDMGIGESLKTLGLHRTLT